MSDNQLLAPGSAIGPIRIVGKITEGGMGEIYQALDEELNRPLALKVLLPSALKEADGLNRFKAEARALARLDHPNIVRIHMAAESEGLHFMALEFIDGFMLDEYLNRYSPSLAEVVDLFKQLTEALSAAHEIDIIHRDIKPQNVMVTKTGKIKLIDFGIAKEQTAHDNVRTSVGIVVGTRSFLAPEILRGSPATAQADVYSLGLILKFMLTGEMPTAPAATDSASKTITGKFNLIIPPALVKVLTGTTQPLPSMRYNDLKEVLKDLNQVNVRGLHPDLLVSIPNRSPVKNLDKLHERCREMGLDMIEARMAINLAAKPALPGQAADNGRTQVLNLKAAPEYMVLEDALNRAVARVKQAKAKVLTAGAQAPVLTPVNQPPVKNAQPQPVPYFKIAFVLIVLMLAGRMAMQNPQPILDLFQSLQAKIQGSSGHKPASTEN